MIRTIANWCSIALAAYVVIAHAIDHLDPQVSAAEACRVAMQASEERIRDEVWQTRHDGKSREVALANILRTLNTMPRSSWLADVRRER